MPTATVTSKGQITIPKEIRDKLDLRTGTRVEFVADTFGNVRIQPCTRDIRSLRALLKAPRKKPVSLNEMENAVRAGAAER